MKLNWPFVFSLLATTGVSLGGEIQLDRAKKVQADRPSEVQPQTSS